MAIHTETVPCLRAWPDFARREGYDPQCSAEWLRPDGSVLRFGDVVLKHAPVRFPRAVRAYRQAARLLRSDPVNRAVPLLGFDPDHAVLMLGLAPGHRLADLAHTGVAPAHLCALAGRWLRAYHGARAQERHAFDAMGPLRRVPLGAAYLPDAYQRARAVLADQAVLLQGSPQMRAVLHGDLNASNLMVSDNVVTGLDFENLHPHPALRDAGQILAAVHLRAAIAPKGVLPERWRAGFETEYGPTGPLLDFFVRQRLLLHWAQLPVTPAFLGPARRHMAGNLASLFAAERKG